VLELCVAFCEVTDLRAVICRLLTEQSADTNVPAPLLTSIAHWAVLSPTELTVAVECLHHVCEVTLSILHYVQKKHLLAFSFHISMNDVWI